MIKFFISIIKILDENNNSKVQRLAKILDQNSSLLESVFADFNIDVKVINVKLGPVITMVYLQQELKLVQ